MENKYLLAKNYNIQQEYVLNSYIDAKDTVNHWCVGQVVDVIEANNQVRVHFEGWSSRYDETIKKNSQRIAPFRRHTEGYTGQKKNTLRDFKFNPVNHSVIKQKVRDIIASDFKPAFFEKPRDITQFIRGELFFYVDSLMSIFQTSSQEEVKPIFEFVTTEVYALIFKWMEIFPSYLTSFVEGLHHNQLFMISHDVAIAQCGSELFGILEKCFGRCYRSQRFFQKYASEYITTDGENNYAAIDKAKVNGLQASFINDFGNQKGFEKVLAFINFEVKDSKDKLVKGCPFQLVMRLLSSFQSMFDFTDPDFSSSFAQSVCIAISTRLDNLQESEIKELEKDILHDVIYVFKQYMLIIQSPAEADQAAELRELQVAQKYLKCPFFEKRVRGINEFKEIYYKVMNANIKQRAQNSDQYECTKWLTQAKYCQWLLDNRIIEFIFAENPHVELIKRSSELIRLLAQDELYFTTDIVDLLWVCCSEKHEDIIRSSLDLVQDLALCMPLERLAYLSVKIKAIKIEDFDEKMVHFLKNYTLNSMRNIKRLREQSKGGVINSMLGKKKEVKIDEGRYVDLVLFWQIFQDSNKVAQKVKDLALNSLIEILQEQNDKESKDAFIFLVLDNIKSHQTFYSSLIFLKKILNTYPLESQVKYRATGGTQLTVQTILNEIDRKLPIFDSLLANLNEYMVLKASDKQPTHATHEDFILAVTGFLEFVLLNSFIKLSFDHVEKLFTMLVSRGFSEFESNCLFELITKENEQAKGRERRFLLDDIVRKEVFQKIFCNSKYLNFEKINLQGFNCFKRLFLIVNEEDKTLQVQKGGEERVTVLNLNNLQGLDSLWSIAIMSENSRVKEQCRDFLVDLYLKIQIKSQQQKKSSNDIFTNRFFAHFENASERPDHQLNCLNLIKTFIIRFDGDHILEEDMQQFPVAELKVIQVTLNPDKATTTVRAHPSQKLWQVKRKMASAFKMKMSEFYIKTKQGPLGEEVYDEQLKEYKIDQLHIVRYPREEMEKDFPRYIIGNNRKYLNLFLELFKDGREDTKREVLSLLDLLPINNDVRSYIRESIQKKMDPVGGIPISQAEWKKLFVFPELLGAGKQTMDYAYCLYYMMALEDLTLPKKDQPTLEQNQQEVQTKQEFSIRLLQTGGFQFLFEVFQTLDKRCLEKDIIRTRLLQIIVKIVYSLFSIKQVSAFKLAVTTEHIQALINENLSIIENYLISVTQQLALTTEETIAMQKSGCIRPIARESYLFGNSFQFISRALLYNPQLIVTTLYQYPNFQNILRQSLIDLDIKNVQESISNVIQDVSVKLDANSTLEMKPSFFFMRLFINDCLEYSLKTSKQEKTRKFFDVINEIFNRTEVYKELHFIKPVPQLVKELAEMIHVRQIKEISARDEDVPLQGLFSLLKNIFQKLPEVRNTQFSNKNEFLRYLIHDCLFHKETRGQLIQKAKAMPPKCKHNSTRERCLELLNELCINNAAGIQILIRYLKEHISETFWRTPRRSDWQITVHQQERSLTGFVGLKNIGCICYMNSIMQQLFMIPTFRKAILEVEDSNFGKSVVEDDNMLHQLKMIFGGLMEMEKQYYNPKKFCSAFKDIDGQPIDPMVQKDVDEFFNMAMDRVENLVKGKKEDKVIKNLFQGVLANEFICKGCPHYSEREEPFMTISLQVKNKHSIKESLEAFVEGEMLEGDNAYMCEKCEKKVTTLKRCCIKRMPNVLFMALKRFEFNFDTMSKFKINDYCEYPMQINMQEYSQEGLAKKDLLKMMEEKNLTMEDLSEEQRAILEKDLPSKYYDYNLRGIVVHIGTADQGHYISYIQDRENPTQPNKWYEFNDHLVREFNPEDLAYETFGGEDESFMNTTNMQQMQGSGYTEQMLQAMKQLKTKIKNAYILIYEREETIDMERFNEFMDDPNVNTNRQDISNRFDQCKLAKTTSAQIQIPPTIHDFILEKNKKFWLSKFIFNKNYIESVLNIFQTIDIQDESDYAAARLTDLQSKAGDQFEIFKFLTTFFLTTVIRAKERRIVPQYMLLIKRALRKNVFLSVWLLETFQNQDLIKEFILDCPIPDMKRFVGGLLRTAMEKVYPFEHESILRYAAAIDTGSLEYVMQTQGALAKSKVIDNKISTSKGSPDMVHSGPCPNLNLVTLSHHNEKLPILVVMINSFIHLSVSQHFFIYRNLAGQFYQVFAHFSEIGEAARLYLLKTSTVGRLLEVFQFGSQGCKDKPALTEKFRSLTLSQIPLFILEKDLYMHFNTEKAEFKMSLLERKQILQDATSPYIFLLYTVSKLSRSCLFQKDSGLNPCANDMINFQLDPDEINMLVAHDNQLMWDLCEHKVLRNAVAEMYTHLSFENKEFSMQFIQTCLNGLVKRSWDSMKLYERPLIKMLLLKDQFQLERIKKIFTGIQEVMKLTVGFYKEMDQMIEIVYKMLQKSALAVDYLSKNPTLIRYIEQWCKENPHIPLNQQKMKVFKQGSITWSSLKGQVINQQVIDKMAMYTKDRTARILSLLTKETQTNEQGYDSDEDFYHYPFKLKERVDFIDQQFNCHTGTIEFALEEMVLCQSEVLAQGQKPVSTWIATEQDKLAAPNTLTFLNEKGRWFNFYKKLLDSLQQ